MFNKTPRAEKQETEPKQPDTAAETDMEQSEQGEGRETLFVDQQAATDAASEAVLSELESMKEKYQQLQDQFTRLAADFDNYRKRMREEQESLVRYGAQKSLMELLPVLDNLERATGSLTENSDPKVLYKSFGVVQKQLMDSLNAMGLHKMETIGQAFDPQYHEAVNRMQSADVPENAVMYEAQSGYQLHDKVIRPAMVVVSMGAPEEAASAEGQAEDGEKQAAENRGNPFLR